MTPGKKFLGYWHSKAIHCGKTSLKSTSQKKHDWRPNCVNVAYSGILKNARLEIWAGADRGPTNPSVHKAQHLVRLHAWLNVIVLGILTILNKDSHKFIYVMVGHGNDVTGLALGWEFWVLCYLQ